jgi:hypothetical protein
VTPRFVVSILAGLGTYLVTALIFCAWKLVAGNNTQLAVIVFLSNAASGAFAALYVYLKIEGSDVSIPPGSVSTTTVESLQKVQTPAE